MVYIKSPAKPAPITRSGECDVNILITGASSGLGHGHGPGLGGQRLQPGAVCAANREPGGATTRADHQLPEHRVVHPGSGVCDYDQVPKVFQSFKEELGSLDRIVVNAGMASSHGIGQGHFESNRQAAETNFVAAIAQCEAAMEIFRAQTRGHLVLMSSVSGVRGFRGAMNVYAATKAAVAPWPKACSWTPKAPQFR
ncbi:SDR family NAD(P)-dependent oxidoreductase [Halomonas beimenensis]|uniref:SDR family NAD(P)-dependent oxidoreductase n=1 Tax=Halomonas beimenensis TaxID=475662 RepID=UPI003606B105